MKAYEGQQYSTLKRQCLQSGLLFEDPRFPAKDDSLFLHGNRIGRVVWKRPRLYKPAIERFDQSRSNSSMVWYTLPKISSPCRSPFETLEGCQLLVHLKVCNNSTNTNEQLRGVLHVRALIQC
uniref:Calpain catalytic domain-containing protein n=1 Tax=Knipowitschia caucasica TaxID=637954 RepID=A0AAV2J8Y5_KNICA